MTFSKPENKYDIEQPGFRSKSNTVSQDSFNVPKSEKEEPQTDVFPQLETKCSQTNIRRSLSEVCSSAHSFQEKKKSLRKTGYAASIELQNLSVEAPKDFIEGCNTQMKKTVPKPPPIPPPNMKKV